MIRQIAAKKKPKQSNNRESFEKAEPPRSPSVVRVLSGFVKPADLKWFFLGRHRI